MQHLPDVARSIQACLLLVSLSGLNILRQELFRYGFLPHGSKWPKHTVARFIQALTLPPLIYPFLPFAQELFRYGFLPPRLNHAFQLSKRTVATVDPNILVLNLLFTYFSPL